MGKNLFWATPYTLALKKMCDGKITFPSGLRIWVTTCRVSNEDVRGGDEAIRSRTSGSWDGWAGVKEKLAREMCWYCFRKFILYATRYLKNTGCKAGGFYVSCDVDFAPFVDLILLDQWLAEILAKQPKWMRGASLYKGIGTRLDG